MKYTCFDVRLLPGFGQKYLEEVLKNLAEKWDLGLRIVFYLEGNQTERKQLMGYVAVTGGQDAIDASIELLREYRSGGKLPVDTEILRDRMKLLIDRVMSEAGLYAPDYAALALKQCEGSTEEAVFLLRAYRSTLSRNYTSRTVHGDEMHIRRRISSASRIFPAGRCSAPPTITYTAC